MTLSVRLHISEAVLLKCLSVLAITLSVWPF